MIYESHRISWQSSMQDLVPEAMDTGTWVLYWALEALRYIPRLILYSLFDHFLVPLLPTYRPDIQQIFERNISGLPLQMRPMEIGLPDGKTVKATFYEDTRGNANTPTILRFPGLGEMQGYAPIRDLVSEKFPVNFVTFDYPGIGENREWRPSKEHSILVALSVYAHLTENLCIPSRQIHFWGMSLGGAIAIETKRRLLEHQGHVFCDRTFSSLTEVLQHLLGSFLGTIAYICLWCLGQDLPSATTLTTLDRGKFHIFNLEEGLDDVIPITADLFHQKVTNPSIQLCYRSLLPTTQLAGWPYHVFPLNLLAIEHLSSAEYIHQEIYNS